MDKLFIHINDIVHLYNKISISMEKFEISPAK